MTPMQMMTGHMTPVVVVSVSPLEYNKQENHSRYLTDASGNVLLDANGNARAEHIARYSLPAAPKGGYSKLVVTPAFQMVRDVSNTEGESYLPRPISARAIADDLVNGWARSVLGAESGSYPGVGIIEGEEPTPLELAALRGGHEAYCRYLVHDGDAKQAEGKTGLITDIHRRAAEYLNVSNTDVHPWVKLIRANDTKQCLACRKPIPADAFACSECDRDLIAWAKSMGFSAEYVAARDPFLAPFYERALSSKKPQPIELSDVEPELAALDPDEDGGEDDDDGAEPAAPAKYYPRGASKSPGGRKPKHNEVVVVD